MKKLIFATAGAALAINAQAASIAYVGFEANVDTKYTTLPTVADSIGWRNTTDTKLFDIDGDHVLGTDGWYGRGDEPAQGGTGIGTNLPGYITGFTRNATGGNNFGYMDDPTDPTGIDDFRAGFWGGTVTIGSINLFTFSISGSALNGKTLRLGVQYDTFGTGSQTYTLTQTVGGSGASTSETLVLGDNGYDWAFFDISGATAGDTFVLSSADVGGVNSISNHQWGTAVFDTVTAIPEPNAALLGGLGMLILLRRRR